MGEQLGPQLKRTGYVLYLCVYWDFRSYAVNTRRQEHRSHELQ